MNKHGNQHNSRRSYLLALLDVARDYLTWGGVAQARRVLDTYRAAYAQAPASTRRRWKCGR